MAQRRAILFLILVACAIAVGCSGQSNLTPPQSLTISPGKTPRHLGHVHVSTGLARTIFAVYSQRRRKVVRRWLGWTDLKTGRPMSQGWSPSRRRVEPLTAWTPLPTPSPGWAGILPDCNNSSGYYCLYLLPYGYDGGEDWAEEWTCNDCNPNQSYNYTFEVAPAPDPSAPPGFNVNGNTSDNPNNFVPCTTGCTLTTCATCWAQVIQDSTNAPPANLETEFCATQTGVCFFDALTILPTVQDVNISSGNQWVNYNLIPPPPPSPTLPPPVMVGQQVELQASPSSVTGVQ
jgi:hypothetical protein